MLLGGLRRCEVLGLRLEDLRLGEWRVFVADGKGGHQRLVPMSQTFFATVAALPQPGTAGRRGDGPGVRGVERPTRGAAVVGRGLDEVLAGARAGPGWCTGPVTSCVTPASPGCARRAWPIEALQAQAGHRSIASTRIYLHLGDDWLADEYRRAAEAIEAQAMIGAAR